MYTCDNTLMINAYIPRETQDFASHNQSIAMYACDNTMMVNAFVPRETQDFASLLWDDGGGGEELMENAGCRTECINIRTEQ